MLTQKQVDDPCEAFLFRGAREFLDGAILIMDDAEAVQELAEQSFVGAYEPDLEGLGGKRVVGRMAELFANPAVLLGAGFPFDEDGAKFALLGECGNGGFIEGFFLFVQVLDEIERESLGHLGENLVGSEHTKDEKKGGI